MPSSDDIRTLVLIYSAVVSTLAIGWNILRDLRNRPSLVVSGALFENVVVTGTTDPVLRINMANSSQRPITIVAVGWKAISTNDLITFPAHALCGTSSGYPYLPQELFESQPHSVFVKLTNVANNPSQIEYLFARDSIGRVYKSKKLGLGATMAANS